MKRILKYSSFLLLLTLSSGAKAQVQVGDDLRMNLNGTLTAGYKGTMATRFHRHTAWILVVRPILAVHTTIQTS